MKIRFSAYSILWAIALDLAFIIESLILGRSLFLRFISSVEHIWIPIIFTIVALWLVPVVSKGLWSSKSHIFQKGFGFVYSYEVTEPVWFWMMIAISLYPWIITLPIILGFQIWWVSIVAWFVQAILFSTLPYLITEPLESFILDRRRGDLAPLRGAAASKPLPSKQQKTNGDHPDQNVRSKERRVPPNDNANRSSTPKRDKNKLW